jgi:hypothetical protein
MCGLECDVENVRLKDRCIGFEWRDEWLCNGWRMMMVMSYICTPPEGLDRLRSGRNGRCQAAHHCRGMGGLWVDLGYSVLQRPGVTAVGQPQSCNEIVWRRPAGGPSVNLQARKKTAPGSCTPFKVRLQGAAYNMRCVLTDVVVSKSSYQSKILTFFNHSYSHQRANPVVYKSTDNHYPIQSITLHFCYKHSKSDLEIANTLLSLCTHWSQRKTLPHPHNDFIS